MPAHEATDEFWREWRRLSRRERDAFRAAVEKAVEDLRAGGGFRPGLRVKGVRGAPGIFELSWAPDGRATFEYAPPVRDAEARIVWRRIGKHEILRRP